MNGNIINEIIAKALSQEATEEEMELLQDWLNQSEVNRKTYDHLKTEWQMTQKSSYLIVNGEELKEKIWRAAHDNSNQKAAYKKKTNLLIKIAASVSFLFLVGSMVWLLEKNHDPKVMISQTKVIRKATSIGQKSKIFLPDGTEVWLNAKSNLTYNENFSDTNRMVHLNGEAFFKVTKDSSRPFIVESKGVMTQALGTSFNIKAYDERIKVALVEGKVEISSKSDLFGKVLLDPGQQAKYTELDSTIELSQFFALEVTSWKEGILYFKDASFKQVIDKLKLWYGVEIHLSNNQLPNKHYTGKFNNESLKNVMENISFAFNFNYELSGKELKIIFI